MTQLSDLFRVITSEGRRSAPHSYEKCKEIMLRWADADPSAETHIVPADEPAPVPDPKPAWLA